MSLQPDTLAVRESAVGLLILFSWPFTSSHRYLMSISALFRFKINLTCNRTKFSAGGRAVFGKESDYK